MSTSVESPAAPASDAQSPDDRSPDAEAPGLKARLTQRWADLRRRHFWIDHAVRAYGQYKESNGDHYAAAITYFSFLALFPVILLAVAIAGFVLSSSPHLLTQLTDQVSSNVPGAFGNTLKTVIDTAIKNRTGIGIVGLVGVLLTGLGWIANLRTAIDAVWRIESKKRSFIQAKLSDAGVLAGLGLGILVSIGLTAGGTAASGVILSAIGINTVPGAFVLSWLIGILLAVGGDMVIFGWLITDLPDVTVPRQLAVRTALLAAVGFEILKIVGSQYIANVSQSPTAGIFGSVVGILVWIDLVSRFLLLSVAWSATGKAALEAVGAVERELEPTRELVGATALPARTPPAVIVPRVSPLGVAAGLLSAGAAVGGASVVALQRRLRSRGRR